MLKLNKGEVEPSPECAAVEQRWGGKSWLHEGEPQRPRVSPAMGYEEQANFSPVVQMQEVPDRTMPT